MISNDEIMNFYAVKDANEKIYNYTSMCRNMRRKCEKCGKSIQVAEKLYNSFKKLNGNETIRSNLNIRFYKYMIENVDGMAKKMYLCSEELRQMVRCTGHYSAYNEKWHLFIGYYAVSLVEKIYEVPVLNEKVKDWKLKGNRAIQDPILKLWMIEAAEVEVPQNICDFITKIERKTCPHMNVEDDITMSKMFDQDLWEKIEQKFFKESDVLMKNSSRYSKGE